jgi:tetratricopeptide (TPR) repeat protein
LSTFTLRSRVFACLTALTLSCAPVVFTTPAMAQQGGALNSVYSAFQKEYDRCNYKDALRLALKAKDLATMSGANARTAVTIYAGISQCQLSLGQYKDAEINGNAALIMAEKSNLIRSDLGALLYNNLAVQAEELGHYSEAETYYQNAIQINKALYGDNSGKSALATNNLVSLYLRWGKTDEGQKLLESAVKIAKNLKGKDATATIYALSNSAKLCEVKGGYKEAEEIWKKAVEMIGTAFGANHLYAGMIYSSGLALVCSEQYKFDEAESYLQKALAINKTIFGTENIKVADNLVALSGVAISQGKYNEARDKIQEAEAIYNHMLGQGQTVNRVTGTFNLGKLEEHLGNYDQASECFEKALGNYKDILGTSHLKIAQVLKEEAILEADRGNAKKGTALAEQALQTAQASAPSTSPELIEFEKAAGHLYASNNNLDKANDYLTSALNKAQTAFGPSCSLTLDIQRELASVEKKKGNLSGAQSRLNSVILEIEKKKGAQTPEVAGDLTELAQIQKASGNAQDAEDTLKKTAGLVQMLPGGQVKVETSVNESGATKAIADKWALVVGISNFEDPTINLKFAAKDATDFANYLSQTAGFKKDHIRLLTNDAATREGIIQSMGTKWLGRLAAPDDLVVVYVSSHGSPANDDTGVNFLVAHDTDKNSLVSTGIPLQWLSKMIQEQVHSNRVVLILDVCHSAAATGGKSLGRSISATPQNLSIGEGQMVICSSSQEQVSWESKNYPNSVFTRKLIESLGTKTPITDAFNRLKTEVQLEVLRDRSSLQTPIIWSKLWRGSAPVLSIEPAAPRPGL